jgi:hypothetical protein
MSLACLAGMAFLIASSWLLRSARRTFLGRLRRLIRLPLRFRR